MNSHNLVKTWGVLVLLLTLSVACGAGAEPTPTTVLLRDIQPTHLPAPSATPTPSPSDTPALPESMPTLAPAEPPTPEPPSWYGADALALISSGDDEQADLYALGSDGAARLIFSGVGQDARVSPDGRWLGFVQIDQDGRSALELHDARSSDSRQFAPDTSSGMLKFTFDRAGRRLAYLHLGAPAESGVPWALVVADLEKDTTARYDALMTRDEGRFLPGIPEAWSGVPSAGDELIINTFLPYTEGGWAGVWGVTFPPDGAPAPLDTLSLRELIPGAPAYLTRLYMSSDGQSLAFLGRDRDYRPDNYFPEFYDLAVNRLEVTALAGGARTLLVSVDDGSALARVLAWSPTDARLLFAQGHYEGEHFTTLTLKSSDLSGVVTEHGPLTLPPMSHLSDLAWCTESQVLYVAWDGSDNLQRLFSFDLTTALSTELSAAPQIKIIACTP